MDCGLHLLIDRPTYGFGRGQLNSVGLCGTHDLSHMSSTVDGRLGSRVIMNYQVSGKIVYTGLVVPVSRVRFPGYEAGQAEFSDLAIC